MSCLVNLGEILPVEQLSAAVNKYVNEDDILEIFHPRVISAIKINCEFRLLKEHLDTIVYFAPDAILSDAAKYLKMREQATLANNLTSYFYLWHQNL